MPRVALGLVVEGAYNTAVFSELILETLRRRCPNFRAFEEKVRE